MKIQYDEEIVDVNIGDYCTDIMKVFGSNNNLMRHLPDIRDSLKPGERRLLYTMYKMGLKPTSNHKKVQAILGTTMFIHPHGDASLHGTITGLGQSWNNTVTLVDGYGNYGSESGADPSAPRYIEGRLSEFAWKCFFEDFDPDVVDMKVAYDGESKEPEYLPSKYPVSLINSHFGIGYGAYCSIPPYNFNEVIDLTIELMDNPDTDNILIYPDLPTKAFIIDDKQFEEACETGDSKFRMRGNASYMEKEHIIRIDSIPFQVSTKDVVSNLVQLIDENKITGIKDIKNRSGKRNGVCIDILLKKEADPISIIHTIYKKTDVQKTFSIKLRVVNDYEEIEYNIRSLLLEWINFRRGIKRRYWSHKVRSYMERKHILETMIFILEGDNLDKTTTIFKTSQDKKEIAQRLMEEYPNNVSSLQADVIAGMRGYEYTIGARERYIKELKELNENKIPEASKIAKSSKKIDNIIKEELREGVKLFGSPRLSKVINVEGELKFRNTKHTIVLTKNKMVKKLPDEIDSLGTMGQDDYLIRVLHCENKDKFFIFDETGNVSILKIADIPNCDLNSKGVDLKDFCNINGNIVEVIQKPYDDEIDEELLDKLTFFMVSKNGLVKKTPFKAFMNINKSLLAMIMKENDTLQSIKLLAGNQEILLFTNNGFGIRFNSEDIKETSRMSMGVKTINDPMSVIVGCDVVKDAEKFMLLISTKGYVKKAAMDTFGVTDRTAKPIRLMGLNDEDELVSVKAIEGDEKFAVCLKSGIQYVDASELPSLPRLSKGKKTISIKKGDAIQYVKKVNMDEE